MEENKIAIIILAAGESKRLGKIKQLVKFRQKTLLEHTIVTASETKASSVLVVLGANAEKIKPFVNNSSGEYCINNNWQAGMSSSIKCGLNHLIKKECDIDGIIIMLSDQPLITSKDINLLIERFYQTKSPIIATKYDNSNGVPALFSKELFPTLLSIKGQSGAKNILNNSSEKVETISIPLAKFDLDTAEDLIKLKEFE